MSENVALVRGWVRGAVVVLEPGSTLPDGAEVRVALTPENETGPIPFTPEEEAEFAMWRQIGVEAWSMIDEWEKEDGREAR